MIGVAIYVFVTLPPHRLRVVRSTRQIPPSEDWEPLMITSIASSLDGAERNTAAYTYRAEDTDTDYKYQFPVLKMDGQALTTTRIVWIYLRI